jgi:hypothetical protein
MRLIDCNDCVIATQVPANCKAFLGLQGTSLDARADQVMTAATLTMSEGGVLHVCTTVYLEVYVLFVCCVLLLTNVYACVGCAPPLMHNTVMDACSATHVMATLNTVISSSNRHTRCAPPIAKCN